MSQTVKIRPMTEAELGMRIEWTADEPSYDVGLNDTAAYYAADPEGYLGLEVDGRIEGVMAALRYSPTYGFSGMYKVTDAVTKGAPKVRLGIVRLIQAAQARFGDAIVGIEVYDHRARQYERMGWFQPAWVNRRYRGLIADVARAPHSASPVPVAGRPDLVLVPAATLPLEQIAAYDAIRFGTRRDRFLQTWISLPTHAAWVCVAAADGEPVAGAVHGFATVRECRAGWQIGPLFADDPEIAEALFRRLVAATDGRPVALDVPTPNRAAMAMAERYGMTPFGGTEYSDCLRMYHNGDPGLPLAEIFGLTTLEIG